MRQRVIVRDLQKRYGAVQAVAGVGFTVGEGEIFGLLGPNGAGKTTSVECLIGLRDADAGELTICGLDARRQSADVKQTIGVALQSSALPDKITPREALRMFGAFYRASAPADELLTRFDLNEKADAKYDTLSGGQRQRLALALAFVNRPQVVFLDEPTTGLDPQARRELHEAIRRMKQEGCTVMLTTHYLEEAHALCDRVAIIDRGRIVATGAPHELIAQAGGHHTVSLVGSRPLPAERVARLPDVSDVACEGARVRFQTETPTATLGALTRLLEELQVEVLDLQVRKGSLEDVFLRLTEEGKNNGGIARVQDGERREGGRS